MSESRAPRTVLLDLDGTFADTLPSLHHALEETMAKHGLPPISREALRPLVSRGARAMVTGAWLVPEVGWVPVVFTAMFAHFLDVYRGDVSRHTRLMDGMQNVVDELHRRAVPWGIVTNKHHRYTEPLMAALDPGARAACIVSGDTTANAKPHPQPLLHACRLLEIAPGDVAIGQPVEFVGRQAEPPHAGVDVQVGAERLPLPAGLPHPGLDRTRRMRVRGRRRE